MKRISLIWVAVLIGSYTFAQSTTPKDTNALKFAQSISVKDLKQHLYTLASDSMQGRMTGEMGQKKAAQYIASQFKRIGLKPVVPVGKEFSYLQKFLLERTGFSYRLYKKPEDKKEAKEIKTIETENVIGFLEGTDKKDEILVISAHYDHVGVYNKKIYYGADDNASGTSTVIELAEAFMEAKKAGKSPRRSILFVLVAGEEIGLFGSEYYTQHAPLFPLNKTVADLNIDMVGRIDEKHEGNPDYIYLIGSDKLSKDLHNLSEDVNKKYTQLELDYTYNAEDDPNRYYYRSDHYNFAQQGIPVIFYFNGVHKDYHQPTDTPDKIDYNKMTKIGKLIFFTAWEIANREERIEVDESKVEDPKD